MTKQANVRWKKLNSGDWGLVGPAELMKEGQAVTVTKASGETSEETVGQIVGRFRNDEGIPYAFATIARYEYTDECIECGERLYTAAQKRSGYCHPNCG